MIDELPQCDVSLAIQTLHRH